MSASPANAEVVELFTELLERASRGAIRSVVVAIRTDAGTSATAVRLEVSSHRSPMAAALERLRGELLAHGGG